MKHKELMQKLNECATREELSNWVKALKELAKQDDTIELAIYHESVKAKEREIIFN